MVDIELGKLARLLKLSASLTRRIGAARRRDLEKIFHLADQISEAADQMLQLAAGDQTAASCGLGPPASAYIARSALATFLLEIVQLSEPKITGLWLDFAVMTSTGCNWSVSQIEYNGISELAARAVVDGVVLQNTAWVMVEDDDLRDGAAARQ